MLNKHSTPNDVLRFAFEDGHDTWRYIILGRNGPTGKTYLCRLLRDNGLRATEITESIYPFVDYHDCENHFMIDVFRKHVVIILNRYLRKTEDGYRWV